MIVSFFSWAFLAVSLVSHSVEAKVPRPHGEMYGLNQKLNKAIELAKQKQYDTAIVQLKELLLQKPNHEEAQLELVRTYALSGARKEALENLKIFSFSAKGKKHRERILAEWQKISEMFYTNETFQSYQNGLNFLVLNQLPQSEQALERAFQKEPDNLLVAMAYGRVLFQAEKRPESLRVLEGAYRLHDQSTELRLHLARRYLESNAARTLSLMRSVDKSSRNEKVVVVEARALHQLGETKQALEVLLAELSKNQEGIEVLYWLGKFYAKDFTGFWSARKYLMTFLRRTDWINGSTGSPTEGKYQASDLAEIKSLRADAEELLSSVNKALE